MRTMTGPEHYREAERLLAEAAERPGGYARGVEPMPHRDPLAAAQVHATLAAAAATALGSSGVPMDGPTALEWRRTLVAGPSADTPDGSL